MTDKKDNMPAKYSTEEIIRSVNDSREYPVDFIREFFINSDKSLEELAIQMDLPISVVREHAMNGMKSWYQLKTDKLAQRMKYFMDVNIDNLTETHSLLEDGHFLTIVQIKGAQEFLKAYYMKHGHLFRVGPDGELSLDAYGMPIALPLPNAPKHFIALEGYLRVKEGTKAAIGMVYEENKERAKNKPDVIDMDQFGGIFEEKKD